jgi:regulatory protein
MPGSRSTKATSDTPRADAAQTRTAAVALLARRDYATGELRQKLRARAADEDTLAGVIADLTREGLLNDERYAHNFVAYHAARGQGPVRIAAKLRQHGVTETLVDAAVAAGPDWQALANKVRRGKFGAAPPASWALKARQARFLLYRGFAADQIRAVTGADPEMNEET